MAVVELDVLVVKVRGADMDVIVVVEVEGS